MCLESEEESGKRERDTHRLFCSCSLTTVSLMKLHLKDAFVGFYNPVEVVSIAGVICCSVLSTIFLMEHDKFFKHTRQEVAADVDGKGPLFNSLF